MKLIKDFRELKKYWVLLIQNINNNQTIYGLFFSLIYLILMFQYISFTYNNLYILMSFLLIIIGIYLFLFQIEFIEKLLIQKMTLIIFLIVGFLLYFQIDLGISNKEICIMIGGIFAFWYGYKKYERDKEIELIHLVKDLNNEESIKNTIINWSIGYKLNIEGKLGKVYFNKIESHSELQFISAVNSSDISGIFLIISELLMYFDKNIYIQNKLKEFKKHWENPEYQNPNTIEFNRVISIFESNFEK